MTAKDERSKRSKLTETFWLFWGMSLTGLNNGIMGPTIWELMRLTRSAHACMQYVFVCQGIGFLVATITTSLLLIVISPPAMLVFSLIAGSAINAAMPWCGTFLTLSLTTTLQGFTKGILDLVIVVRCTHLWPENHAFPLQFIATGVALGAVVAPFLAEPFLPDINPEVHPSRGLTPRHLDQSFSACLREEINYTTYFDSAVPSSKPNLVFWPYTIVAAVTIPPTIAFLYYFCIGNRTKPKATWRYVVVPDADNPWNESYNMVIKRKMLLTLVLLFHVPFAGFYLTYSDLLTPFGIKSQLHITNERMAAMTAIFWLMFLIGRCVTTMFSRIMSQFALLLLNSFGLIFATVFLVIAGERQEIYLWLTTAAVSFFNAPFLPGALSWLGQYITMDKTLITMTFIGAGIGELLLPFVGGYLFAVSGPSVFVYVILGITSIQMIIFILLFIVKNLVRPLVMIQN